MMHSRDLPKRAKSLACCANIFLSHEVRGGMQAQKQACLALQGEGKTHDCLLGKDVSKSLNVNAEITTIDNGIRISFGSSSLWP